MCKRMGHYAQECPGEAKVDTKTEEKEPISKIEAKSKLQMDNTKQLICHKKGHNIIAMECPNKVWLCQQTKLQDGVLAKQLGRPPRLES